jgi:hypothetical protein
MYKPGPRHHHSSHRSWHFEPIPSPRSNVAAQHRFERDFLHEFCDFLASDPRLAYFALTSESMNTESAFRAVASPRV